MSMFKQGWGGSGERYEYIVPGSYVGELTKFTEGRLKDDFNDPINGPKKQMINWHWLLYQADGVTPVMHDGNQVEYVGETSDATGERSTAAKWFSAHLRRKFDARTESVEHAEQEAIGKKAMLIITENDRGFKKTDVFPSAGG